MVFCQFEKSINCACALCGNEDMDDCVAIVAREALVTDIFKEPHPSLSALKTEQWDSTELFSFSVSSSNDLLGSIQQEVRLAVLKVFNEYNFACLSGCHIISVSRGIVASDLAYTSS
jgi:hypothetical protein